MPELPEVETLRRDLAAHYAGRTLAGVAVIGPRTVRRHAPERLAALVGQRLTAVGRHGKYLVLTWRDGQVLVAHMRMSGQLLAAPHGAPRPTHTHAVFSFKGADELRFVDPRTFGELFLGTVAPGDGRGAPPGGMAVAELSRLGPDALVVDAAHLGAVLTGRRAPLKSLLVDQRTLAGIGNIYADEICFRAGLRPDRPAGSLARGQVEGLAASVHAVLEAAIAGRGSSLADAQYRDLYGKLGRYQLEHHVYGRAGLACLSCGQGVERVPLGARSAFVCAVCQI